MGVRVEEVFTKKIGGSELLMGCCNNNSRVEFSKSIFWIRVHS